MQLILVRHGATAYLEEGRFQGTSDLPLSATGVRQVEELAAALFGVDISVCLTSDLRRARETAQILTTSRECEVIVEPRIRECSFGVLEGLTRAEAEARHPEDLAQWWEKGAPAPGVETPEAMFERVNAAYQDALERWPEGTVLAVSHSVAIRMALAWAFGMGAEQGRGRFRVDPASATELTLRAGDVCRLTRLNWRPEWRVTQ